MESENYTREELAQYILNTAKDAVVNKINKLIFNEKESDIMAHNTIGEPLDKNQYKSEIKKGLDDIKYGRVTSDDDLAQEIKNW